jgi:hypothetical protein
MRVAGVFLSLGLSVACGAGHSLDQAGPAPASNSSVSGTVAGVKFPSTAYAVAIPNNESGSGDTNNQYTQLTLAIAGKPLACDTKSVPASLFIGVQIILPGAAPVGPGTYPIDANPESAINNVAALVTTDAHCAETGPATCVGGSVTIKATSDAQISGSFTLAFDSGETMTGTFDAVVCASVPQAVADQPC